MWEFNLVVTTASEGRFRHLLEELRPYGDFHKTGFLGVLLGKVNDPQVFLEEVRQRREERLIAFQDLGRAVPVERTFTFGAEEFLDKVKEAIAPYIERLAGKRFYVRLERRGLKGTIVSPEVERAVDAHIEEELARREQLAHVDFEHPEAIVVIETVGDRCGVGLLTEEMIERYRPFVRVS
ncbi:MAG: hypothetical protein C0617_11210 [Desulfuromonas sp.]|uniref:THUMP domain-containing protein n=1 Tax=Desulfuromonas sp. TaxID=892 RepID=UPI000CBECAAB|nr:THUMP domain-containing protein [Desulfuromonas sp.]PLX83490.1 MAG: hypothetical protein C0617_11210 [Desulfuromonas sp.]